MSVSMSSSGPGLVPKIVTGAGAVVIAAGLGLALIRPATAAHSSAPVTTEAPTTTVMTTEVPAPAMASAPVPAPVSAGAPSCVMFCDEPPLPPADASGCRLFCDVIRPTEGGVR
ncbi:hypothetical protein [Nocardia sp. BMG111209]|uniref:hypothetical protein n=1 Tax=Nocardia sp. BMG111209 TaxID=1160137 RepID=UPI00037D0DE6|nr:hypothetical protein [Nocardia sp. BMG111209]